MLPFIRRFAAAAEPVSGYVEFLFPYGFAASEIKTQLSRRQSTLALFNTSANYRGGRVRDVPRATGDAEHDARADIDLALEYALAWNASRFTSPAGVVPDGDGARYRATFIDNLRYAADRFAAHDQTYFDRALSPGFALASYLFSANIRRWASRKKLTARKHVFISSTLSTRKRGGWQFESLIRGTRAAMPMQIASLPDRHEKTG